MSKHRSLEQRGRGVRSACVRSYKEPGLPCRRPCQRANLVELASLNVEFERPRLKVRVVYPVFFASAVVLGVVDAGNATLRQPLGLRLLTLRPSISSGVGGAAGAAEKPRHTLTALGKGVTT